MISTFTPRTPIPKARVLINAIQDVTAPLRLDFILFLPTILRFLLVTFLFRFTVRYLCGEIPICIGGRNHIQHRQNIQSSNASTWTK